MTFDLVSCRAFHIYLQYVCYSIFKCKNRDRVKITTYNDTAMGTRCGKVYLNWIFLYNLDSPKKEIWMAFRNRCPLELIGLKWTVYERN